MAGTYQAAPPPATAHSFYGNAWNANSLANLVLGAPQAGRTWSFRFRAEATGAVDKVRVYVKTGPGYSAGNGGQILVHLQTDDNTANHWPSGRVLTSGLVREPLAGAWNRLIQFDAPASLRKGELFHIVFSNPAPDALNNFVSINTLNNGVDGPNMQPGVSDTDLAVLVKWSEAEEWVMDTFFTPIFDLHYTSGARQGQGYIDVKVSGTLPIAGRNQVREIFTVSSGDRRVSRVAVRLKRVGSAGPLAVRLERGDGSVMEEGTIAASAVGTTHGWGTCIFASSHTLANGQTYRLVLKTTAGGRYEIYPLQEASGYGFGVPTMFTDGRFQYSTDGTNWTNFQGGWGFDMQFYFTVI